ncbi:MULTISPECIES: hypothetical protein [Tenebrionibacter/Tenebrionicola group]|jgi:hypothetical protein|uniref:Uncharacterized protein n=2 Tax=Tenebrionibacter/Tenebrionicola group TaxID=2969848 RepID=A0A8K0V8M2_9ENTR|nr:MULTISPECIES: hypothetical protein [Tenebrionibacter/Tenebrionicola group]MBK4716277.1 hypothetical protein [Tenebrionibacter intestinalis]MBV4412160.1 hypothetical protein [Tenebrionicola larvae]MBV5097112.1 hypothetical protein [Tenebrionicola larvae]
MPESVLYYPYNAWWLFVSERAVAIPASLRLQERKRDITEGKHNICIEVASGKRAAAWRVFQQAGNGQNNEYAMWKKT